MQRERRDNATLLDIQESAKAAISYIQGMDKAVFSQDRRTQKAAIYEILTIGEAVKRLSKTFCELYPEIPWSKMAKMRDKLVHDYDQVNLEQVWLVLTESLPELISQLDPLVQRLWNNRFDNQQE